MTFLRDRACALKDWFNGKFEEQFLAMWLIFAWNFMDKSDDDWNSQMCKMAKNISGVIRNVTILCWYFVNLLRTHS